MINISIKKEDILQLIDNFPNLNEQKKKQLIKIALQTLDELDSNDELSIDSIIRFIQDILTDYSDHKELVLLAILLTLSLITVYEQFGNEYDMLSSILESYSVELNLPIMNSCFPVFKLLNSITEHNLTPSDGTDVFAVKLLSFFVDCINGSEEEILTYFKNSFEHGINVHNSLAFLKILDNTKKSSFRTDQQREKFLKQLLSHFQNKRQTKNWIVHLVIASYLYGETIGQFKVYALKNVFSYDDFLAVPHTNYESMKIKNLAKIIEKSYFTTPLHKFPRYERLITELFEFVGAQDRIPRTMNAVKVAKIIFFNLYKYLYDEKIPIRSKDRYSFLYHINTSRMLTSARLEPFLKVALQEIDMNDESKLIKFFNLLDNIALNSDLNPTESKKTFINLVTNALLNQLHKNRIFCNTVIEKLKEYTHDSSGDVRLAAYQSLYSLTKNKKYLEMAALDKNKEVQKWAKDILINS